ncbi:hypothetical protein JCM39194_23090 [Desulfotomaculum varum]
MFGFLTKYPGAGGRRFYRSIDGGAGFAGHIYPTVFIFYQYPDADSPGGIN